jgi:hypothetical protein
MLLGLELSEKYTHTIYGTSQEQGKMSVTTVATIADTSSHESHAITGTNTSRRTDWSQNWRSPDNFILFSSISLTLLI